MLFLFFLAHAAAFFIGFLIGEIVSIKFLNINCHNPEQLFVIIMTTATLIAVSNAFDDKPVMPFELFAAIVFGCVAAYIFSGKFLH